MRLRLLPGLWVLRHLVRELAGIREQLTRQTDLLARLADQVAPQLPVIARDQIIEGTGVDYVDPHDQALALDYVQRTERDTGRTPTDDEILSFLADEKTQDLHARLLQRDRDLERVQQERQR